MKLGFKEICGVLLEVWVRNSCETLSGLLRELTNELIHYFGEPTNFNLLAWYI